MLERVARAVQTHLQNDIEAKLDIVEAYWTGQGHTLALEDPVTWLLGFHPTVVERDRADYPIIAVTALEEDPDPERSAQWGYGEGIIPVMVNWFVDADTETNVNLTTWRYGEAIDLVMRAHRKLATGIEIDGAGYVPATDTSNPYRQAPELGSEDEYFYTQMGMKTFRVRARE